MEGGVKNQENLHVNATVRAKHKKVDAVAVLIKLNRNHVDAVLINYNVEDAGAVFVKTQELDVNKL